MHQPVGKDWRVKPDVDGNASHLHSRAFAETGAGEFDLHVDKDDDTVLSAAAGVEVSGDVRVGKDKAVILPCQRPGRGPRLASLTSSANSLSGTSWPRAPIGASRPSSASISTRTTPSRPALRVELKF
jgi:hypothetical protein